MFPSLVTEKSQPLIVNTFQGKDYQNAEINIRQIKCCGYCLKRKRYLNAVD